MGEMTEKASWISSPLNVNSGSRDKIMQLE